MYGISGRIGKSEWEVITVNMMKIGALIAGQRKKLGYTQDTLGEAVGVTGKAVSKWERGLSMPDIEVLNRLAAVLKLDILSLLTGERKDTAKSSNEAPPYDESAAAMPEEEAVIRPARGTSAVSPLLFGTNLEHSRSDIQFGLCAQMLRNRKFAGKPSAVRGCAAGWEPVGERAFFSLTAPGDAYTRHDPEHYHMRRQSERHALKTVNAAAGEPCGIKQGGLSVRAGEAYDFAVALRCSSPVSLRVALTSGGDALCAENIDASGGDWERYTAVLTPDADSGDSSLEITYTGASCVAFGAVSLMQADSFHGMRRDVIELLKTLGIKMLRWPGGNFAGDYNWFDGLMPVDMRAPLAAALGLETQPHTMGFDNHEIATDDFIALCREIGAEPFITVNPAWNTPEESAAWAEYCNGSPDTPYGGLRASRGFAQPYRVRFWSLGNEFGYGHMEGDNTPFGYSRLAREHAAAMREKSRDLAFCVCSPYPDKTWIDHVANALGDTVALSSLHLYLRANDPADATPGALRENYERCVCSVSRAEHTVRRLRGYLKPEIKISFDEWNLWEAWYRPSSVTEGMFTALMLHFLMRDAEKDGILISCQFEAVNEGLIEVTPTGARLTAAGQMFAMMSRHTGGTVLHAGGRVAVTERDDRLTATVLNPEYAETREVFIEAEGTVEEAVLYRGDDLLPGGRFAETPAEVTRERGGFRLEVPPRSAVLLLGRGA